MRDKKIFKWIKRVFFGFIFERISRSKAGKIIPHGEFADVGGHKLHYYLKGEEDIDSSNYAYEHAGWVPGYQSVAKYHKILIRH